MRKSQRIPSTKQTRNLYGILYYTNNTGRKTGNKCVLQENQPYQTRTSSKEELENRNIRTITNEKPNNRNIRNNFPSHPHNTDLIRRGGNMECRGQANAKLNNRRQSVVSEQTLIDSLSQFMLL